MSGLRALGLAVCALAMAGVPAAASVWDLEIGPLAGATAPDASLADYRWDTTPQFESGLETTIGKDRWRAGLRLRRSRTTQGTGLDLEAGDPTVRATNTEILGRYRAARPVGVGIWITGHAGWMNLGYTPGQVTLDTGTGLDPVTVKFGPVNELALGGGLMLRRILGNSWALALSGETSTFGLDTAHRRGDEIVYRRDRFWNWSVRLAVTWRTEFGS